MSVSGAKRPGKVVPAWMVVAVAIVFFAAGVVFKTVIDLRPRYTTFSGCLLAEMEGHQEKMLYTAAQLCREKVAAGDISK